MAKPDTKNRDEVAATVGRGVALMQAVVLRDYGGFDRLRLEETDTPTVGAGEILIRNAAVGINHCDTDVRRGVFGVAQTFPHVMGVDSAGEVAAVGPAVSGFTTVQSTPTA